MNTLNLLISVVVRECYIHSEILENIFFLKCTFHLFSKAGKVLQE